MESLQVFCLKFDLRKVIYKYLFIVLFCQLLGHSFSAVYFNHLLYVWRSLIFFVVPDKLERLFFPLKNALFPGHSSNFCEWLITSQFPKPFPCKNPSSVWWQSCYFLKHFSGFSQNLTFRYFTINGPSLKQKSQSI